jgi:hypothetical protein
MNLMIPMATYIVSHGSANQMDAFDRSPSPKLLNLRKYFAPFSLFDPKEWWFLPGSGLNRDGPVLTEAVS